MINHPFNNLFLERCAIFPSISAIFRHKDNTGLFSSQTDVLKVTSVCTGIYRYMLYMKQIGLYTVGSAVKYVL